MPPTVRPFLPLLPASLEDKSALLLSPVPPDLVALQLAADPSLL
jgi:hypothetical protein